MAIPSRFKKFLAIILTTFLCSPVLQAAGEGISSTLYIRKNADWRQLSEYCDFHFERLWIGREVTAYKGLEYGPFRAHEIIVEEANPYFYVVDGLLMDRRTQTLVSAELNREDYVVPEGTLTIGRSAFNLHPVHSIQLPKSLISIDAYAFCHARFSMQLTFPNGLVRIGEGAFEGCSGLTKVNLSQTNASLDAGAFCQCRDLASIALPANLTELPEYAFAGCENLEAAPLPDTLETIRHGAFAECYDLQEAILPDSLKLIEPDAFRNCFSLRRLILAPKVRFHASCKKDVKGSPDQSVFAGSNIELLVVSGSDTNLPDYLFTRQSEGILYEAVPLKGVLFLCEPPKRVASNLFASLDTPPEIFYSQERAGQWQAAGNELLGKSAQAIDSVTVQAMLTEKWPTPTPTPTLRFSPTPVVTPHSRLTHNPEAGTSVVLSTAVPEDAGAAGDPAVFVLLGLTVCVGIGVVVAVRRRGK